MSTLLALRRRLRLIVLPRAREADVCVSVHSEMGSKQSRESRGGAPAATPPPDEISSLKVVFFGDIGVGKRSLFRRFTKGTFTSGFVTAPDTDYGVRLPASRMAVPRARHAHVHPLPRALPSTALCAWTVIAVRCP